MTDRENLAARIEAAGGPDRELDAAIAKYKGYIVCPEPSRPTPRIYGNNIPRQNKKNLPRYTGSIDAAMMLAPEGHLWHVSGGLNWGYVTIESGDDRIEDFKGNAATPALALSAAAIRAGGA